jgi:hypothetical protein
MFYVFDRGRDHNRFAIPMDFFKEAKETVVAVV